MRGCGSACTGRPHSMLNLSQHSWLAENVVKLSLIKGCNGHNASGKRKRGLRLEGRDPTLSSSEILRNRKIDL